MADSNKMTGASILSRAMKNKGKSQADLARYLGCTRQNVGRYIRRNTLTFDLTVKLLAYCGYKISVTDSNGKDLMEGWYDTVTVEEEK